MKPTSLVSGNAACAAIATRRLWRTALSAALSSALLCAFTGQAAAQTTATPSPGKPPATAASAAGSGAASTQGTEHRSPTGAPPDQPPPTEEIFRDKFISLGTASRSGSFFPIGSKLCELVNQDRRKNLVRCVAYRTAGSEYNSKAVTYGDLVMGLTRSDIAHSEFMEKGSTDFRGEDLRAVMSLYEMPVVIIARRSAGIADVTQLRRHSINLGNRGSGQRVIVELLLRQLGLTSADFSAVTELNTTAMGEAFCAGKVDVIVEALGNPSPFYRRMIEQCNGRIVTIPAPVLERILAANPQVDRLNIPGGLYAGHPDPIPVFGYKALLVTSKGVSDESVRRFVSSVMDRLSDLQRSDPVLRNLDPNKMFTEGVTIPLHSGVTSYLSNRNAQITNVDSKPR